MLPSSSPSTPTRRAVLAAAGTAVLAGCSDVLAIGSSQPRADRSPATYTWPTYGYDAARCSHVSSRELPSTDADRIRRWLVDNAGSRPVLVDGRTSYRGWDVSDLFVLG